MFVLLGTTISIASASLILIVELVLVHGFTVGSNSKYIVRAVCYTLTITLLLLCPATDSYFLYNTNIVFNSYTVMHMVQNILIFFPLGWYWRLTIGNNWCILIVIAYALAVELLQLLVPGRVCDIMDIIGNSIGGLLAIAMASIYRRKIT